MENVISAVMGLSAAQMVVAGIATVIAGSLLLVLWRWVAAIGALWLMYRYGLYATMGWWSAIPIVLAIGFAFGNSGGSVGDGYGSGGGSYEPSYEPAPRARGGRANREDQFAESKAAGRAFSEKCKQEAEWNRNGNRIRTLRADLNNICYAGKPNHPNMVKVRNELAYLQGTTPPKYQPR